MQPADPHLLNVAIAVGLGLLVGLQRESLGDKADIGGVRTFALVALLGASGGLLGPIGIGVGLLGVAGFFALGNWRQHDQQPDRVGMTTEIAALVVFALGSLATVGHRTPAVFGGAITVALLHFKPQMHRLAKGMEPRDLRGVIQLAVIGMVILPVLPDETYGPYDVLNPHDVWLMVVLIVGISLAAYASYRILGAKAGAVLGGILGGLISSTATTVSYARHVKGAPASARLATLVILIASTIVNARVLVEIGAVSPGLLKHAAPPVGAVLGFMVVLCALTAWWARGEDELQIDHDNPAQLKAALIFGGLYAVVLFVVAAVKEHFGEQALYAVAVISGLTDVDAITLSTAEMVSTERVSADTGWRVVLVAASSNLVFKGGAAIALGGRPLMLPVGVTFGASIAAGLSVVLLWP